MKKLYLIGIKTLTIVCILSAILSSCATHNQRPRAHRPKPSHEQSAPSRQRQSVSSSQHRRSTTPRHKHPEVMKKNPKRDCDCP